MRKITVFSFFKSNNIGDLLIADRVSEIFSREYDCTFCDITGFEKIEIGEWKKGLSDKLEFNYYKPSGLKKAILDVEILRSAIGAVKAKRSNAPEIALGNCEESELVIFAGGNSLMELGHFPASLKVIHRTVKLLKDRGKSVSFCFCGAGPFRTKASFKLFGKILSLLDFISVRDDVSYKLVKKACPTVDVEIWRDPVLLTETEKKESDLSDVGVNVYFGHSKGKTQKMKNAFTVFVKKLRERAPERKIYLFSSELTDIDDIIAVKNEFSDDGMVEVKKVDSVKGLFSLYDEVCCVLGTRMHTVITATASHKPVMAISWQSKVTGLMDYFGKNDICFDMDDFIRDPEKACDTFVDVISRGNEIVCENDRVLSEVRQNTAESIKKFKERF